MSEPAAKPKRASRKLEYPAHLVNPEPTIVNLRRGVHALLGFGHQLLDSHIPGHDKSLMQEMIEVCAEGLKEDPVVFRLCNGARLLQELFGPETSFKMQAQIQGQIRSLCVTMTALEVVATRRYRYQPVQPLQESRPGRPPKKKPDQLQEPNRESV